MRKKILYIAFAAVAIPTAAQAQVPDLVNALDAGGRAMGMGSANNATGSETLSGYYNPAGLGYLHRAQIGLAMRNLPKAASVVTGDLQGAHSLRTVSSTGPRSLTHAGVALPLRGRNGGTNGTISVAYTTGGEVRDDRFAGTGLQEGGLDASGYQQSLSLRNDFLSLAYGRSNSNQTFNWGLSLLYALNHQSNLMSGTPAGPTVYNAKAHGWGGLFGVQFMPRPDTVIGLSYRTPISLKSDSGIPLIYDKVPARATAGIAWRKDMRGSDFLVLGGEINHFFEGSRGRYFDSPAQTTWGLGLEYNYSLGEARVPLRVGYNFVPGEGNDFADRNTITFGAGYYPSNSDWGVNVNFARPRHGGTDMGLNLMYRFGK